MHQIASLELRSRVVVDGFLSGKHRSTHKGGCCEFAGHRSYAAGDDARRIDWQVYARNDRFHIRQYEEETNLQAVVAVDASGSMGFGGDRHHPNASKLHHAATYAACIARLLLHQRDAIGAAILSPTQPVYLPPRRSPMHLTALLSVLGSASATGEIDLGDQLRRLVSRIKRRGMMIVLTDGFGDLESIGRGLRVVRASGHDVILFQILDPAEARFDFDRWTAFESLEDDGRITVDPAAVRAAYLDNLRRHVDALDQSVVAAGGDYVRVLTDQPPADVLSHFLRSRAARLGRSRRGVAW